MKLAYRFLNFGCIALFLTCSYSAFAQNSGVGTPFPTHTLHVKPLASNPERNPIRIENFQPYQAQKDSMLLVVDPTMGVVRVMHIDSVKNMLVQNSIKWETIEEIPSGFRDRIDNVEDNDSNPTNEIQNSYEVNIPFSFDVDHDGNDEKILQEALDAIAQKLPKGVFKTIGEARLAGLEDGDSFYAHPRGVLGCNGCVITLFPGMN